MGPQWAGEAAARVQMVGNASQRPLSHSHIILMFRTAGTHGSGAVSFSGTSAFISAPHPLPTSHRPCSVHSVSQSVKWVAGQGH